MARTEVAPAELTANAKVANPALVEVLTANGAFLPLAGKLEETILEITPLEAGAVVKIKAGDNPPALAAGQGDLVIEGVAENVPYFVGPLTSARFVQAGADDGQLFIDTNKKIKVRAFHVPRTA